MKIDRIYISGYRGDQRYTRCCVASVRRWYPYIPITLIKDTLAGDYDTNDLERYWQVSLLEGERKRFGPAGKLEPLFLPTSERFLVMDSDVVFLGRVLDAWEDFDEDVVVNGWDGVEDVEAYYFSVEQLQRLDPNFLLPERAFPAGNFVARSGLVSREDFSPFIAWTEPPRLMRHDVFRNVDQGTLNYVLLRKFQDGAITMRWHNFMWWSGEPTLRIDARRLHDGDAYPYMLHWAGTKHPLFRQMPQQQVLDTYERLYYARIPNGRLRRDQIVANETWRLMARRLQRKVQPTYLLATRLATTRPWVRLPGLRRIRKTAGTIKRRLSRGSGYSGGGDMTIKRVFIAGYIDDLRWTQCCVASIRRWYPDIRITLIKDRSRGDYDTSEMEVYWGVDCLEGARQSFGWGLGKLEPLALPTGERCLVLDSDIVFVGRVLDVLDIHDEDFIVDDHWQPEESVLQYYYDLDRLSDFDPDFSYPGYTFNSGSFVTTTGILPRVDFEPYLSTDEPPQVRHPDIFKAADQGLLNYIVQKRVQMGELTIQRLPFQEWAGWISPRQVRSCYLHANSPYPYLVHFAGTKKTLFSANRNGHLLRHFEAFYYSRLPNGRRRLAQERLHLLFDVLTGRTPKVRYI